jgi:hypothetical protein
MEAIRGLSENAPWIMPGLSALVKSNENQNLPHRVQGATAGRRGWLKHIAAGANGAFLAPDTGTISRAVPLARFALSC